jgi:[methyl-Co(III) methanol-specific corrinoid protein]:coenzyme M methyltransferase
MESVSVPTILHICGKVDKIVADMIATGCSALSFEPKTDMSAAKQAVETSGRKLGLIGGVDTVEHLFYGNAGLVKEAAVRAIKEGYTVIAPGCSIPPATATESLKTMLEVACDVTAE